MPNGMSAAKRARDTRAGHYERNLQTKAGAVRLAPSIVSPATADRKALDSRA